MDKLFARYPVRESLISGVVKFAEKWGYSGLLPLDISLPAPKKIKKSNSRFANDFQQA